MLARTEFLGHLREALNHLHDPDCLIRSPLAALFGVANRYDTYSALQAILIDAIAALEPGDDVPPDSRAWRIYDLLSCRYVQELSVPQVANQLGVSVRHLRREQRAALELLAYCLWEQSAPEGLLDVDQASATASSRSDHPAPTVTDELAWLREAHLEGPTDVAQALHAALSLVKPLAGQYGVRLELTLEGPLPGLAVHPVALSQILVDLLGVAIHRASRDHVSVSARPLRWEVGVDVHCRAASPHAAATLDEDLAGLRMAQRLVELCGCRLSLSADDEPFAARVALPAFEQLPVLVIDDNADSLKLLRHYTLGSRYRLVGTRDPEQVIDLARTITPQIVVLDVMMPQVDGWRVLGRLRQHPLTSHLPIIVCTILAQEDLARSLGASDFIRKPVTQQALLAALDRQVAMMASESR